jgi:hypothetical protein
MNALIVFGIMVAIALVGWGIAEIKSKACSYNNDKEEKEALQRTLDTQKKAEYAELGIRDVMRTISTKGFKAV